MDASQRADLTTIDSGSHLYTLVYHVYSSCSLCRCLLVFMSLSEDVLPAVVTTLIKSHC